MDYKSYFKLKERKTNLKVEILAGITTFLTMVYIVVVQKSILEPTGMDVGAVIVSTALIAAAFTILMGWYTNLPYALAPGMGGNFIFAYLFVSSNGLDWQTGLGVVFISGMIFLVLTIFGIRELIVKIMPKNIKIAIGVAIGFFVASLGFTSSGFAQIANGRVTLGDLSAETAILALIGFGILVLLTARKIKAAPLIAIILTTAIAIPMGITSLPDQVFAAPPSIAPVAFELDILSALKFTLIPVMFTFFVGDFFSTLGTLLGVSAKANLLDENGNLPNIKKPFLVDSLGTVIGALFGTTTVTTYVESSAGVEAGGRTGLTAITTGICFFFVIFITPLIFIIPNAATAPVLIGLGIQMIVLVKNIEFDDYTEYMPALFLILVTTYVNSISAGISAGIIAYVFIKVATGRHKELNLGIYILCIPLIYYFMQS